VPGSASLVRRDCGPLLVATAVTGAFLLDGRLARVEGVALVATALADLVLLARSNGVTASTDGYDQLDIGRVVAGLTVVVVSGHFLMLAAADLARLVVVSEWVVGATVVAAGTSTPELATSVAAAARQENAIAAGTLVGSSIFNPAAVLGLAVVVQPLAVQGPAVASVGATFLLVAVVDAPFWTGRHLSRLEGLALLVASGAYWAWTVL
jgi:cation:H+ antiporter